MKTYDEIVLDKIKENQPITANQLAIELGYINSNSIWAYMNKLVKNELILKDSTHKPYKYTVNEVKLK